MGPVLKTLLGLYLFIWTIIGVLVIAGGFMMASQLPELKASLSNASQALGGKDSGQNQSENLNQAPADITPEMQACIEKALGKATLEQLKSQNSQLTTEQQQAFQECGFTPKQPGSGQGGSQTRQNGMSPSGTPQNGTPSSFVPNN